jgi:glucose-6-phosphate isomerase
VDDLRRRPGTYRTAEEIASSLEEGAKIETVFRILEHMTANPGRGIARQPGPTPFDALYGAG